MLHECKTKRSFDVANIYELLDRLKIDEKKAKELIDPKNEFKSFDEAVKEIEMAGGHIEVMQAFLENLDGCWDFNEYETGDDWRYVVWEIDGKKA